MGLSERGIPKVENYTQLEEAIRTKRDSSFLIYTTVFKKPRWININVVYHSNQYRIYTSKGLLMYTAKKDLIDAVKTYLVETWGFKEKVTEDLVVWEALD